MSRSGKTPHGSRCVLNVEGLEDRTVPSGNVQILVGDRVLYVSGDEQSNQIVIGSAGKDGVLVRSLDGTTTINGQSGPVFFGGVKRGFHLVMRGGDDVVQLIAPKSKGGVNADMGDGHDFLEVSNAQYTGPTILNGGAGNDAIVMRASEFRVGVSVNTGTGDDQVIAERVRGQALRMVNPSGTDFFDGSRASFQQVFAPGFLPGITPGPGPDTTAPTVDLTSTTASTFNSGTVDFTATFNEDVTGFSDSGVTAVNGTVGAVTQVDARTYRFSVTPTGQGVVSATVNAGAATDAAGNANLASATVSRTFDSTAPVTPTLDLVGASDSGTIGDLRTDVTNVTLVGTTEAGATVTLFNAASGTVPGTGTVIATTTANATGVFTFTTALALGPTSFVVRATDAFGNNSGTFAQTITRNAAPVATPVPDQNLTVGGAASTIDLTTVFSDAERIVRFMTQYPTGQTGNIDINLFADDAPTTVANFLAYINSANANQNYNGAIFHRLAANFVLQGGGFKFDDTTNTFITLTKLPAIVNEPGISNTRGTIAMAKQPNNPNSATNEFFFNLNDNSANLDTQNGGFSVFGQVMNGGQATINGISQLNTINGPNLPGAPPFPVRAGANTTNFPANIDPADLAVITTAAELGAADRMIFTAVSNDTGVATVSLTGPTLTINPAAAGTTTITVRATDLDGSVTTIQITVNVT